MKDIINKVSTDTGIPKDIVEKTFKAYWLYIRNSIQELPLKEDLSKEEFLLLRTSFNIPSLGKLSCTYDKYLGIKEKFENIKILRKRNEKVD